MKSPSLVVLNTSSGRFKVYVWGQADAHLMDWRGCNFRRLTVPRAFSGQPTRGYASLAEAFNELDRIKTAHGAAVLDWARNAGDGTHMSDNSDAYTLQVRPKVSEMANREATMAQFKADSNRLRTQALERLHVVEQRTRETGGVLAQAGQTRDVASFKLRADMIHAAGMLILCSAMPFKWRETLRETLDSLRDALARWEQETERD